MRPAPPSQSADASRSFVRSREGIENFLRWGRGKVWQEVTMGERLTALCAVLRPTLDAMRESERQICAAHTREHLDRAIAAIVDVAEKFGVRDNR